MCIPRRIGALVCLLVAASALGGPESEVGADTHGITLELIMRDPAWIARSPERAYWSDDGASVYFSRQREDSDLRDLYRVDARGGEAVRVEDERLSGVDVRGGDWRSDRGAKVFARDGDLFVRNLTTGSERQLTRTRASESSPAFMRNERQVRFWRSGKLLVRDLDSGLEWEPAEVRFAPTPEEAREKRDGKREYLDEQQDRFFDVLREQRASREERDDRRRALREIDRSDVPGPFYLPVGLEERRRHLSPDGRWMIVVGARPIRGDKRDEMPKYVTETGYVETVNVRPKVGEESRRDDRIFLLDLEKETWVELKRDGLPTIKEDPLAWLRERDEADDTPDPGEEKGATAEEAEEAEVGEDAEDDQAQGGGGKPRSVSVLNVRWRPDGSMAGVMLRSDDNKDRWIAIVDPDAPTPGLEPVHHLRDEAWIGWRFNEFDWLRDGSTLWYLSEERGHADLFAWDPETREVRVLAAGAWEASDVAESPDGAWLYFRANRERPIEYQVYRVGVDGAGPVERVTDHAGSVSSFHLSPDGERVLYTASSAIHPPEIFVGEVETGDVVALTDTVSEAYASIPWVEPALIPIEGAHGEMIWTKVYQVEGAWEGEGRPGVVFVHGAGYTQNSDDEWPYYFREQMFHSMLAYLGYVVIDMDYRASAGYGRDWRTAIYRNMGRPELEDFADGIDWMVRTHGVDPERVGIYGGSYGGFMALMALFLEPETYACGAALRPVTDWAHYNHGYTSNILNTPELDPEAFERSSPIEHAEGLADPLLICHGMLDDNVVFQDTVRLAQRLIELGKEDWEVAMYPLEPHSFTEASSWLDEYRRVFRLFERRLRGR